MPNVTGMEALPRIREVNPEARIVIMTAFASYGSKVEAREKGAYDYVLKPINLSKMKDVAEKALPDRRQENGRADAGTATEIALDASKIDHEVGNLIPERMARTFALIATEHIGQTVTIAMAHPIDIVALDTLKTHITYDIKPVKVDLDDIMKAIRGYLWATDRY